MEVSQISHRAAGNSQYFFTIVWLVLCSSFHTALCRPSESTMSMNARIEPRTVAESWVALSVRAYKHNGLNAILSLYKLQLFLSSYHWWYRIAELSTLTHVKYVIVDLLIYVFNPLPHRVLATFILTAGGLLRPLKRATLAEKRLF
jgi:hypothetical protein